MASFFVVNSKFECVIKPNLSGTFKSDQINAFYVALTPNAVCAFDVFRVSLIYSWQPPNHFDVILRCFAYRALAASALTCHISILQLSSGHHAFIIYKKNKLFVVKQEIFSPFMLKCQMQVCGLSLPAYLRCIFA
jgi:hypothetical protein